MIKNIEQIKERCMKLGWDGVVFGNEVRELQGTCPHTNHNKVKCVSKPHKWGVADICMDCGYVIE